MWCCTVVLIPSLIFLLADLVYWEGRIVHNNYINDTTFFYDLSFFWTNMFAWNEN